MMGIFIKIHLATDLLPPHLSEQITRLCPVDIFAVENGQLVVKPDSEDECTLCELCLDAAPADAIRIAKTYRDETLLSRGSE